MKKVEGQLVGRGSCIRFLWAWEDVRRLTGRGRLYRLRLRCRPFRLRPACECGHTWNTGVFRIGISVELEKTNKDKATL